MKFPPAKLEASKAKTQLKRFATVEVYSVSFVVTRWGMNEMLTRFFVQDVADQVKCLVESKSMTGQNIGMNPFPGHAVLARN